MARLNLDIPDELKRRAKVKAAQEWRTLTDVIERLLTDWLETRDHGTRRRADPRRLRARRDRLLVPARDL